MIKFDGMNSLFLPNFSRNSVSTFSIKGITKDDFKIKTRVKIDWDNLDMNQRACGIVVLNGMDMGIFCGMYKKQKMIMAQIWTQGNKKADMEQVWVDINDDRDTFDIEIDYQYQSGLTLKVDKDSKTLMFKNNIVDSLGIFQDGIDMLKDDSGIQDFEIKYISTSPGILEGFLGSINSFLETSLSFFGYIKPLEIRQILTKKRIDTNLICIVCPELN